MDVAIIGGGAAGFFSAIAVKENYPDAQVIIYERSKYPLAKVKISGGGRCNVTNGCRSIKELSAAYPRGGKSLQRAFKVFNTIDTMQWFESRGVPLVVQEDNCVFPKSQSSQTIIDCFLSQARALSIEMRLSAGVKTVRPIDNSGKIELTFIEGKIASRCFDKVIVATGGSPKRDGLRWLEALGHTIVDPVPSLFTFNMPTESITELMGVVVENTIVTLQGTKLKGDGPLLITHWGMSGPAILKLSAYGSRLMSESGYKFNIQVNWVNVVNHQLVMEQLRGIILEHPQKLLANVRPYYLPERLWIYLITKSGLTRDKKWHELSKQAINRLVNVLTNDVYLVKGKASFKEEFVTCGGISLESIDFNTMQSRVCKNLYFAGELLDIDGITGGYNFQAAWTTGFIAGRLG